MKAKLTSYEKNVEEWQKRDVWMDVILLSFTKPIKYDYPIPDKYHVNERAVLIINKLKKEKKIPKTIADKILNQCWAAKYEYSSLEYYMSHEDKFGNEWFCGYAIMFRWRDGEISKAKERIQKYIPKSQQRFVKVIQDAMELKFEKIHPFDLGKVILK